MLCRDCQVVPLFFLCLSSFLFLIILSWSFVCIFANNPLTFLKEKVVQVNKLHALQTQLLFSLTSLLL